MWHVLAFNEDTFRWHTVFTSSDFEEGYAFMIANMQKVPRAMIKHEIGKNE